MGDGTRAPTQIIALPQGGGALRGLGEKFSPELQTGTGNFTVPIAIPAGRRGHQPTLELVYSTGNGNGHYGLGWALTVPGIARKTSHGVPRYDRSDTFILSGAEDLVPLDETDLQTVRYRPRTEGLFARVVHHRDPRVGIDHWEVASRDGLVSRYGTLRPDEPSETWLDPSTIVDPDDSGNVFAWKLTETWDPFGNRIVYEYDLEEGNSEGHRWRQPLLRRIRYADYTVGGKTRFFANVVFDYDTRDDAFSDYRAGFEIRTTSRCRSITTMTHADKHRAVRRYELDYDTDRHSAVSLLRSVQVVGFDDDGVEHRDLPPLDFGYSRFMPEHRSFQPVRGADPPPASLDRGDFELVDLTGDGLPDVLELSGAARYWRNLGDAEFDRPRPMRTAPSGLRLADPGVQLLDVDGDGRADLLITKHGVAGYFPLRFGAAWGDFRPYRMAPSFNLEDPEVRLVDLTGNGVTDVLRAGTRLECWFQDSDMGWSGPRPARHVGPDPLSDLSFADPRVKLADMTGDGLQDIVLVHSGKTVYWPNLGHGRWGSQLRMTRGPRLPDDYDPARVLLGDINGDGPADFVYVDDDNVKVWLNRSGNSWSEPITIKGTPAPWIADSLRLVDLLGTGTRGVLYSRDVVAVGRPSMFFLDLTGGTKPGLLTEVDNHIGAVTQVGYRPSTAYAIVDNARPDTRWRTPLPIVVPVVSHVEIIDQISGGKLSTTYSYRHGYWDGTEREFRGFGCVEQSDSETFENYHTVGLHADTPFCRVGQSSFSPPTLTRTWFHLGPVDTDDEDQWVELDLQADYWGGDPELLGHTGRVNQFLRGLQDSAGRSDRRARRDALRALRGLPLRTELYGRDGSAEQDRPYTISEHAYNLREETTFAVSGQQRVFAGFEVAARTTQWERGTDPMTQFTFTGDHDPHGQPRRQTIVAPPRRWSRRQPVTVAPTRAGQGRTILPDETRVLGTHTRTTYTQPDFDVYIHDRVAQVRTFELVDPPTVDEQIQDNVQALLIAQLRAVEDVCGTFDKLTATEVRLIGHSIHHYDGVAYVGRESGKVGPHGLLTRSETLIFRDGVGADDTLANAYGPWRPTYLGGPEHLPADAPLKFGADLGYRHEPTGPAYAVHVAGWYADTARNAYDVQLSTSDEPLPHLGLLLGTQDPLGHESRVTPDAYWLFPAVVRDVVGLETTASYNYRSGQPDRVVDPNGNATNCRYHPLGLLSAVFLEGRSGEGGTEERPETAHTYSLSAYALHGQPISVHTAARVWHANDRVVGAMPGDVADDLVEIREYSDGFGQLVQKRTQADELTFGSTGDDVGLLIPDLHGVPQPVPGQVGGSAVGTRITHRVVVSGWQVNDNKGRVVETYEPFFDAGWDYQPASQARHGKRVTTFRDPRGQVVRVHNPDGSQQRTAFGVPDDLTAPDTVDPTPWALTTYDGNDLAPVSSSPAGASLAGRAAAHHHFTPATVVVDALGRTACQILRGGPNPTTDWYSTQTTYDIRGNVLTVVDELGRLAFSNAYDLTNRSLRVDSIDANRHITVFDAAGNAVAARDARGCMTLRTYDVLNRPAAVFARDQPGGTMTMREQLAYGDRSDPNQPTANREAARGHNRLGRLWLYLDEAGLVTNGEYDFTGKVTIQVRQVVSDTAIAAAEPDGWTADWAAPGARTAALDPALYQTTTRYDALSRVVEVIAPTAVAGEPDHVLTSSYGRSGALRSVSVDGVPFVRLIAYNARGQRVLTAFGDGSSDGAGPGPVTRYAYDPDDVRLFRLRTERMTPEAGGDIWAGAGGAPHQDLTYAYDLVGNVTVVEERTTGCGVAGTAAGRDVLVRRFSYDPFYRLTSATGRACANIGTLRSLDDAARCGSYPAAPNQANAPNVTTGYRETYTYDPAGNLLDLLYDGTTGPAPPRWHRVFGMGGLPPNEWADAPTNRLTSVRNGDQPDLTLNYDDVGNMLTEAGSRRFTWNHAGRMVGFRTTAGAGTSVSVRYLYAADGLRVKKWVQYNDNGSLDESTVYLAGTVEHHQWRKQGGGHSSLLHVGDGDRRIALVRTGTDVHPDDVSPAIRFELADHLGSASLTLDAAGAWTNREEYFPYGETSFGSFRRKRYRYTGKERDEESGLTYHGARYYHSTLSRWITCDPRPVRYGALYSYGGSSPLRFVDPSGMAEVESAAPPGPPEPELNLVRGPYSTTGGHHSQMTSAFPDPVTGSDPFRGRVTTTSQAQGDLASVPDQPSRHQAICNVQNATGRAVQGVSIGTKSVGLTDPLTNRPAVDVTVVDGSGSLKPTPSTWFEQIKAYFGWRGAGASRQQALGLTCQDVAERQLMAAEQSIRTGKPVSPLPTRVPGGSASPQVTVPVSPGTLEVEIPGWTSAAIAATTRWLSTTTLSFSTITQALQVWGMAEDLEQRGVINTQIGAIVRDRDKAFRGAPDFTPVSDFGLRPNGGVHGYIIHGQYVPIVL